MTLDAATDARRQGGCAASLCRSRRLRGGAILHRTMGTAIRVAVLSLEEGVPFK